MKTSYWGNRTIDLSVYSPAGISRGNPRFSVPYTFQRISRRPRQRKLLPV